MHSALDIWFQQRIIVYARDGRDETTDPLADVPY